ncbi:MAG: DNA polymerase III subunit delta [Phototrophicales bacterium]
MPFYIIHGTDDLGIDEAVKKFRAEMGNSTEAHMNTSEFDGSVASVPEVINAVSSYPFLSDKRLVIVKGMLGQKGVSKVNEQLKESLPNLPDYARLVFVEHSKLPENNAIIKLAKTANGHVLLFEAPKDPVSWIIKRAKSTYQVTIEKQAAVALAAVVGDDMRLADNELIKLVSYVQPGQPITEDDVATLTPYVPEASIFQMVDAIAEGRGQVALQLMHRLMQDKKQDAFSIMGMIIRQFRLLLMMKAVGSGENAAEALKIKPFVVNKLKSQVRAFSDEQLERIYRALHETDIKIKTGGITPELALDLFVASVATHG